MTELTKRRDFADHGRMPLPPLRFGYIVLAVADVPAMRDWYCQVLGFELVHGGRQEVAQAEFAILDGHGLRLELGARLGGTPQRVAELPAPEFMDQLGWRVLTFHTDDLDGLKAHLEAHGANLVWHRRVFGPGLVTTLFRDPEGNLINVFGPKE